MRIVKLVPAGDGGGEEPLAIAYMRCHLLLSVQPSFQKTDVETATAAPA